MDRHASPPPARPRTTQLDASRDLRAATLAAAGGLALVLGGCGAATPWRPVPVEGLVTPPDPPPPFELGGTWAWEQARARAATAAARPIAPPPATPKATPIAGDFPRDLDATLAASAACKKGECALEALVPKGVAAEAGSPAALWAHDLGARGATVTFPRSAHVDVYGVVVKGQVKIRGAEEGKARPAGVWTAFRLPGAGASISADGGAARVVLAAVSSGEPLGEAVAALHAKGAPKLAWKARPAPIALVDLAHAQDLAWAAGSMHARLAFEGDGQRAALGLLLTSKDARVAPHAHDGSWEVLGALRPSGAFARASAPGKDAALATAPLAAGAVVAVPKGVKHAWEAAAPAGLVAVQFFVPPGPEQRFHKAAEAAAAPPK